jgi:hypothetical protein
MDKLREHDSIRMRGQIDGILYGIACRTDEKEFEQDRWESLYGCGIVHSSYAILPKDAVKGESQIIEWDVEREQRRLKSGVDLLNDRAGTLVFEDGTAVIGLEGGKRLMLTLREEEFGLVEHLSEAALEATRDAYNYSPATSR